MAELHEASLEDFILFLMEKKRTRTHNGHLKSSINMKQK